MNITVRRVLKESYPPNLHCARLLLLLSGVSLQAIPYLGTNIHRGRDRKILSPIVEVMEVSDSEENFHISEGNLSEQGQVEVNAYGSPVAAQAIARGGEYSSPRMKTLFTWYKVQGGLACCFKSFFL